MRFIHHLPLRAFFWGALIGFTLLGSVPAEAGGIASTASSLAASSSNTSSAATGWYWGWGRYGYRGYGWGYNHPYHRTPYLNFAYSRYGWGNTYGYGPFYNYYGYGFNGRAPYAWGWPYRYTYGWNAAMYARPLGVYSPGYYSYQGINGYAYTASSAYYAPPVSGIAIVNTGFAGDYAPYVYYGESQYARPALMGLQGINGPCCQDQGTPVINTPEPQPIQ